MFKDEAIKQLDILRELIEALPDEASVIAPSSRSYGDLMVYVTKHYPMMGTDYQVLDVNYHTERQSYYEKRFYPVGEFGSVYDRRAYGYMVRKDVTVTVEEVEQ